MFDKHVFPVNKTEYIRQRRTLKKDHDACILCAVRDRKEDVVSLEVYRAEGFVVSLNLYPYNPAHVLVFPERHTENIRDLTDSEIVAMHHVINDVCTVLDKEYMPQGYNIGFNIGKASGASIAHVHCHIVPRYEGELGFIDIIAGAKVYIEEPLVTFQRLKDAFLSLKK